MPGLLARRAGARNRTADLRITSASLYQLSYSGVLAIVSTGLGASTRGPCSG